MQECHLIAHEIHGISHCFFSVVNCSLKQEELTKSQMDIIRFLIDQRKEDKLTNQRDLERYFSVSNPTISGLLDRLEKKGMIVRTASPKDKRIRNIELTEKAITLYDRLKATIDGLERTMLRGLSPEQIEQGLVFLQTIMKNLKEQKGESHA